MTKNLASAVEDFHRARLQAKLEGIIARLTGRSTELLSYEQVRRSLGARERYSQQLEDIPLDAIVGSVGRYKDFTRSFLPKQEGTKDRWARVEVAMTGLEGVPPIEVYKVGDVYFVRDGNHRVSVARQLGSDYIQAYVTEVETKVPLSSDVEPDDLIIKAEYAAFLEHTNLDEIRPHADLRVTAPGQYQVLEEHIEVHHYFMGLDQERHIPYEEAVAHWYDEVYLPVVRLIRQRGILRDFPERTKTDLYLWLSEHRAELEEELGWQVSPEMAASDLATQFSQRPGRVVRRIGRRVLDTITPDELELGPPAGQWREERLVSRQDDRLFASILVAIRGDESGWSALEQALAVAHREGARLQGLHVLPSEDEEEHPEAQAIRSVFERRCHEAAVEGHLAFDVGPVQRKICDRARWSDLVVTSLKHPPGSDPMAKISSGIVTLIRRCPRPVFVVPEAPSTFHRALLAYDGTPKAREALFVATYISGRWDVPLTILSVMEEERVDSEAQAEVRDYLEAHGIEADYDTVKRDNKTTVSDSILTTATQKGCDLILMGGYGVGPMVEAVLGSTVDQLLRKSTRPMLICR
jgi:nucleotide-binding universal stress UspA family protein